jgi:hypothetical protein
VCTVVQDKARKFLIQLIGDDYSPQNTRLVAIGVNGSLVESFVECNVCWYEGIFCLFFGDGLKHTGQKLLGLVHGRPWDFLKTKILRTPITY